MSYAIVQISGKQYKVSEGDKITVARLEAEEGETVKITDVLLASNGTDVKIGEPLVAGAEVSIRITEHNRAPKIRVAKFKSKSKYRKVNGHKQLQTLVEVIKIKA
ncbi:MAG: 50S ribosomal protein L21 [Candidatus Pacebacteria bacterium]|nr:50S ribosomal protein L21 [Candidatus Paceibacterota bacterium]PIR63777.1 MAG: 50S ribosomal protein L21 [Candidatus Pacebacteria bacterium CG10_big_fil_rev_8_21_14_0_10_40_26]PIZ78563.1 MAG: 50S ribosomal protein L21 [Candidatus Pacebacteria bacterium CG_4_10_14_0_2_um_filter_40_20]PJA69414.1 MAG: 50S ribosomal protein L21 [Candidatus Pacebacteria bacterium CG_4_9_14_3_um_filter_40_12]PJC41431.1 MAG: 50S ribosomal protein L21 [Candidatus Pacebacteria bacterium CG_4_9_14_0_2_um_filter_40_15]